MKDDRNIFVSVVMPTYNGANFIKRSIQSILDQSHDNFEFIIVDDGSTDSTAEIIKSYSDSRIIYIYQDNKGPAGAYNSGFKISQGDFIFIMDHDDYSYPCRIQNQLSYMKQNSLSICGTCFEIFNEKMGFKEQIIQPIYWDQIKQKLLLKPWTLFNPTLCIRKTVFEKHGYFDEMIKYGYDYKFILETAEYEKCGNVQEVLYQWRLHKYSYGWINKEKWEKYYSRIAIDRLNQTDLEFPNRSKYFHMGMVFYNANTFHKASYYFFKSLIKNYLVTKSTIYFLLSSFLFPIIVILRRLHLFSHPLVVKIKKVVNDFP